MVRYSNNFALRNPARALSGNIIESGWQICGVRSIETVHWYGLYQYAISVDCDFRLVQGDRPRQVFSINSIDASK